jgi:hypothetical protein
MGSIVPQVRGGAPIGYTYSTAGFSGTIVLPQATGSRAAASGLNGLLFTVTKISDDTFSLNGVDRIAYNAYTANGGQILINPKAVSAMTSPNNAAVATAPNHGLATGQRVVVQGILQPMDFNGNEYEITKIDSNTVRLEGTNVSGVLPYTSGGYLLSSPEGTQWTDTITENMLDGELYLYKADQYAAPPPARFAVYLKGRTWLFGVPGQSQKAYYSEVVGGDGGAPADDAVAYPQKYAAMFKGTYSVSCAAEANTIETGMESIIDDLYFFLEERVYALFGGDPLYSSPVIISQDIGCIFPYTICRATIPYFGGMCILFLSNRGPAVVKNGGEVVLVNEFKAAELWPGGEIFADIRGGAVSKLFIQQNCTAMFWRDTWTVAYKTYAGNHRVFELYFNPEMKNDAEAPRGVSEIELAAL